MNRKRARQAGSVSAVGGVDIGIGMLIDGCCNCWYWTTCSLVLRLSPNMVSLRCSCQTSVVVAAAAGSSCSPV